MTAGRCIGRVGGLAVALGIGTALAGWGDCPAWADTTAGAAGSTTSSQSAGTPSGAPEKKQRKPVKPKPKSNKHADTADRDKADKDKADKADKDKPDKKVQKPAAADKPSKGEVGKGAGDKGAVDKGKADKADEAAHRVSPPGVTAAVPAKTVSTSRSLNVVAT